MKVNSKAEPTLAFLLTAAPVTATDAPADGRPYARKEIAVTPMT